jgi:hypothetical protein
LSSKPVESAEHREKRLATKRAYYHAHYKEKASLYRRQYYVRNKEKEKSYNLKHRRSLRPKLIALLGQKCAKCGFSDERALVLDHIKGGGMKEINVFDSNYLMYVYYIDHPTVARRKLQVLCANCNSIKRYENGENYVRDTKTE